MWKCIRCGGNGVEAYEHISVNHCKDCIDELISQNPQLMENGVIDEDIRKALFPNSVLATVKVDFRQRLFPKDQYGSKCHWLNERICVELAFVDMNHVWEYLGNAVIDVSGFTYPNIDAYKINVHINHVQKLGEHKPYATFDRLVEL